MGLGLPRKCLESVNDAVGKCMCPWEAHKHLYMVGMGVRVKFVTSIIMVSGVNGKLLHGMVKGSLGSERKFA